MKIVWSWELRGLEVYVYGSEKRLLQAARGDREDGLEAASVLKKKQRKRRNCKTGSRKFDMAVFKTN